MISLVQASITSTSGLLPESVRIWFFLSSGSTIKKLWGCQEGLRTGWHRIGDGVDGLQVQEQLEELVEKQGN
jgi:hypothetical protein